MLARWQERSRAKGRIRLPGPWTNEEGLPGFDRHCCSFCNSGEDANEKDERWCALGWSLGIERGERIGKDGAQFAQCRVCQLRQLGVVSTGTFARPSPTTHCKLLLLAAPLSQLFSGLQWVTAGKCGLQGIFQASQGLSMAGTGIFQRHSTGSLHFFFWC